MPAELSMPTKSTPPSLNNELQPEYGWVTAGNDRAKGLLWLAVGKKRLRRALAAIDRVTVLAFTLPFCLYVLTLAPTIYNLDSAELTTAAATNGLVRATGYPLYLLLGKLWALLPAGDVGYRLNLMSAFFGALTIALAERILRRQQVGGWARAGALGLLATAPYFWSLSLVAEVYTLHTALMAGLVGWMMRWAEQPTRQGLAVGVWLAAISMGNHAATVLLLPALFWYVVTTAPHLLRQWQTWTWAAAALLLGLSVYLLLPWRYTQMPAFNYVGVYNAQGEFIPTDLLSPRNLWWLMSGRTFAGQMMSYTAGELWQETVAFVNELGRSFFAIGLGPGLLGLAVWLRRDWRQGVMLLLMFLGNAFFYINYRVIDKNTMFLPNYLIWALWLGLGYQALLHWIPGGSGQNAWQRLGGLFTRNQATTAEGSDEPMTSRALVSQTQWLVRGVMLLSVVAALAWTWRLVDLSEDWSTRELGESIMAELEPNAIVLGWWDTVPVLQYLQLVEGARPDVTLINRFLISGQDLEQLIYEESGKRPIYINNPPVAFLRDMEAVPVGPIFRLQPRDTKNVKLREQSDK